MPRKSIETSGSVTNCMMPFKGPSEAAFSAPFTSSAVTFFSTSDVRSTTETFGVGTRIEVPSILPFSAGSTSPTAFAAPVVVGMIDMRRGTRAPQILVRQIEEVLIVRVGVHRHHPRLLDAEGFMEHLGERCDAIGRARRVRDDVVFRRVVLVIVHAHHHGDVGTGGRRGDDHLARARGEVLGGVFALGELAGALEHDVDAEIFPGQLRRILDGQHLELIAADLDGVGGGADRNGEIAEHRVVLQKMSERLRHR